MFEVKIIKRILKQTLMGSFLILLSTTGAHAESIKATTLLSYTEWKHNTRSDIQKKLQTIQQKISNQKESDKNDSYLVEQRQQTIEQRQQNVETLASQLRFEKLKLEASEDLSFHEYFVGYLLRQKDFDQKITELSKILKPEEVKELMASYGDLLKKRDDSGKHGYSTNRLDD